jgi:GNAT superfamily N-acetyltransferase
MVEPSPQLLDHDLEGRVLARWGALLGVDAGALDRDGLVVIADRRDFAADRRATLRTARGTLLLAAPAEAAVATADSAAYVVDVAERARAVGLLHYGRAAAGGVEPDPRIRVLGPPDRSLLNALHHVAGGAATEEADVDVEHPLAVGIVEDGRLLAIASLLDEGASAVDVGVLVAPAARGRGLGAAVVKEAARRAVEAGRLVQYRCNRQNEPSAKLARACGFVLWGVLTIAALPDAEKSRSSRSKAPPSSFNAPF